MTCYVHKFDRISGRSTRSELFVSVAEAARAIPMVAGIISLRPDSEPHRLNDKMKVCFSYDPAYWIRSDEIRAKRRDYRK